VQIHEIRVSVRKKTKKACRPFEIQYKLGEPHTEKIQSVDAFPGALAPSDVSHSNCIRIITAREKEIRFTIRLL
jgi:hypothetical protein